MAYKVPFVGYKEQYLNLKDEFDSVFKEIMSQGDFILRRHLEEFENNIASYVGTRHAIGVNSGTDALYLSAQALGFGPGDEIITVSHTFVATIGAIVQCGAKPVLIDIRDDFNMDVRQIEPVVTSKTKGIIPVHLNGCSCQMDEIMKLADKYNLKVIEDAAQALGASFNGKRCGSFGNTGIFSFYPAKMLGTAGDGGMVCTDDDELAHKLKALRDNGRVDSLTMVECFGYCSRLDNLHAAILNMKFKHFPGWVEKRREIDDVYYKGLKDIPEVKLPLRSDERFFDVYQNYVIRVKKRDELVSYLKDSGIEILVSWPIPLHRQKSLNLNHFNLPVTEQVSSEVISLPMYPELNNEKLKITIEAIKRFFSDGY
ncbi:MAG: DegT/DnrJ/EryC1/StrS family aminotransferase [Candidatus Omnitrophota bacterium]|nr:DegT/DnrJ/EryC1/StrS family aminotransferase [Candidatus Omnitrophota bacterium]